MGSDALGAQLPALLRRQGCRRVLLAAGGHFLRSGAADAVTTALAGLLAAVRETPDGLLQEESVRAQAAALPPDIDAVIAIGGGRTIDYAKALLYYYGKSISLFAAVPTTAGSGSDATSFAVLYSGITKRSLEHPVLKPGVVVWEEGLLAGLSARQRAVSGLDALVQCLESLWSRRATPASRALAWEAGNWLRRQLPHFVAEPSPELALGALYAAHHSGAAIETSRTTGPHALSYYLSAVHGVEHGHAVALLLPVFLRYNESTPAPEGYAAVLELLGASGGAEAAGAWQQWIAALGLESRLSALGLHSSIIPGWLQHINEERFANNPLPLDAERLSLLLHQNLFSE
ncbi:hypothetical protein GCM10028786_11270 [Flaviaesturariibacter terrae]